MRTVVVIPAYNEGGRVGETVRSVLLLGTDIQVVVVDDGSWDGTCDAAQFAGATVLRHAVNRGQGAALQTGTEWALAQGSLTGRASAGPGADYIVHFDADGQFDAADISRALAAFEERQVDIILGSRMLNLSLRGVPTCRDDEAIPLVSVMRTGLLRRARNDSLYSIPATKRYVLLPIARLVNWAFTGVWLTDAHNGFRVLSRRAAEQIVIHHDRMAHNTDIIAQIRERGLSFAEMPIRVRYDRYGQGLGGGVKIVSDLLVGWFL